MNDLSAWDRFCKTGSVTDYLMYRGIKNCTIEKRNDVVNNACRSDWDRCVRGNYAERQEAYLDTDGGQRDSQLLYRGR